MSVYEGDPRREVSQLSSVVRRPVRYSAVEVWAGYGTNNMMAAVYKNLLWSNTSGLLIIKPHHSLGTVSYWGFVFSFSFKIYVSQLPGSPSQVSSGRGDEALLTIILR